ncbi:methylmalonyl-CoA epimerase [Pedobacter sp. MC2016-14]|uniref:methylmalonyl-CoA epimerase n=1 Tax=Pedobacter sp. MC2016-14 TaxID=2897327 RepID=UPI001E3559F6|nr:methylmalonyl-CoA epimerase [Pedobacter sp. MC2016-14]MCD0490682.1 methylmalonyl-CoA epimerase [Pedobacter sp. MC2016-14]
MKKIEHIGIAVKDLELSCSIYEQLLGTGCYKKENVSSENVDTAFFLVGPNKIELLAATDKLGTISKFIENKGEGLHHIAFEVDDILQEMDRLKAEGFQLLSELPKPGADNKLVCFVHPKQASGVLIELCQEIKLGKEC